MQKKIIAMAIAAAISAPAFADNANVTVYGKAILDIENVQNDKSTLSSATRVQTNASRFGVKGKEDLGDGLSAFYQYEVTIDANGDGKSGAGAGTRNSGVGLEGGFGTVIMGTWDTPFKTAHNKMELFDNTTVFSATNVLGRTNVPTASTPTITANNFNTRATHALVYVAPSLADVVVTAAFSPDQGTTTGAATSQGSNKSVASLSGVYDVDSIYVAAAYENRADNTTAGKNDTAARLVARYTLGDFWVGATVENITINNNSTSGGVTTNLTYTQNNSELAALYKMGASSIGLSYVTAGATNWVSDGANQVSLRYGYNLSKRTELFAAYTQLKNDKNGTYGFNAGNAFGTNAGSTQTAFGTGMIVSF